MKNNKTTILVVGFIAAILFGGGGFFAGMTYQKSQRTNFIQFAGGIGQNVSNRRFGMMGQSGNGARGGSVIGEILSSDDKSITVKLVDGSSKIVILSGMTTINKAATGTKDDLKTGERVAVFGSTNTDGSVTAQNIQLNPVIRGAQATPSQTK